MSHKERLAANLAAITADMEAACHRAGRAADSVTLVAVTKYAPWSAVQQLADLHPVFGESRPQQLAERAPQLPQVEWHLIGQLQRNKVPLAIQHTSLIHSVDSLRLLERIQHVAAERGDRPAVLLQVNLSGEASKSGFSRDEVRRLWSQILQQAASVRIEGLMTMAAESNDPEDARPAFRQLRELRDELLSLPESAAIAGRLPKLSMGMSGDFIPAIEEGATLVRIGSRLFEGIDAADT